MDEQNARKMGYMRFGVISPLLTKEDLRPMTVRFMEQAQKVWTLPDGRLRQFSVSTIADWYYDYCKRGMDALVNPPRKDRGSHRVVSEEICQAIDDILKSHPTLKSSTIIRVLDEKKTTRWPPSQRCYAVPILAQDSSAAHQTQPRATRI